VEQIYTANDRVSRKQRSEISYERALNRFRTLHGVARVSWATWIIVIGTILFWCFTAYQVALASGAQTFPDVLGNIWNNAVNIQNNDALTNVLVTYGAKENDLIIQGQYWRFITPVFLHANLLHVGLNMLNLLVLGVVLERLMGHLRFILVYFVTGMVSIIASFYFMPSEVSVGASGAIFGLVGAYSVFVLMHRRAFRHEGIPALLWLVFIIGLNLGIGLIIPNVDNFAHLGGLLSGCLLGWWFMPLYRLSANQAIIDVHSLTRRWPLALLTIVGTLILASVAIYVMGG